MDKLGVSMRLKRQVRRMFWYVRIVESMEQGGSKSFLESDLPLESYRRLPMQRRPGPGRLDRQEAGIDTETPNLFEHASRMLRTRC